MSDVEGAFKTLLGSLQSHFEDRLKSPFGGAFIIAWFAINWKAILVLIASTTPIEARIASVSAAYFSNTWSVLWLPLIYAVTGVIGYYLVATVFVTFFECYGVLRRIVERWFDSYRWVPPNTYIETKRATRLQIKELTDIASDQIDKIARLQEEAGASEAARTSAEAKAQDALIRAADADAHVKRISGELELVRLAAKNSVERSQILEQVTRNLDQAALRVGQQLRKQLDLDARPKGLATLMLTLPGEQKKLLEELEASQSRVAEVLEKG